MRKIDLMIYVLYAYVMIISELYAINIVDNYLLIQSSFVIKTTHY